MACGAFDRSNTSTYGIGTSCSHAPLAVRVIQGMYFNAQGHLQITGQYNGEFGMGVSVHQDSVLITQRLLHSISTLRASKAGMKVNSSLSTWSRPSSWFPALALMFSWTWTSAPVFSAAVESATAASSVRNASLGSIRSVTASLVDWWPTNITSAPSLAPRLGPLTVDQWLKWILTERAWWGGHYLLTWWHALRHWGCDSAITARCWPRES